MNLNFNQNKKKEKVNDIDADEFEEEIEEETVEKEDDDEEDEEESKSSKNKGQDDFKKFILKLAFIVIGGIVLLFIVLSIYYARPFCKYICPLGAIYSLFNPISIIKLRVDEAKCTKCSSCQRACPMDIAVYKNPRSLECIRCGDCISSCPHKAIEIISSL